MSWTNKKGFNFRDTLAFVTDGTNETAIVGDGGGNIASPYPTSKTIDGDTFNVGWDATGQDGARDRDSGANARLAGINFAANGSGTQITFRIDLPSAGTYELHLALGDTADARANVHAVILDTNSALDTISVASLAAGAYVDVNGTTHTSAANWASNEVGKNYVFSTSTLNVRIGHPSIATDVTPLAHLAVKLIPDAHPIARRIYVMP